MEAKKKALSTQIECPWFEAPWAFFRACQMLLAAGDKEGWKEEDLIVRLSLSITSGKQQAQLIVPVSSLGKGN